jgi:tRNA pseudouridine32 synthase/23S rRNA pseudouridine746 synthase
LIIGDMAKSRRSMYKLLRTSSNPAVTQFFSQSITHGMRLYLLKPLSGKTHQLRVALASIGVPILGDQLYGNELSDRCYLHAYSLHFTYRDQAYVFQQPPSLGQQFLLSACQQLMANQWQSPNDLPWPSKD